MLTTMIISSLIALIPSPPEPTPTPAPTRVTFDRASCEVYDDGSSYLVCRARDMKASERLCAEAWERDGDAWWSCVVGLESWRCEVQGWCGGEGRVTEAMPTVDVSFAGRIDWDAI